MLFEDLDKATLLPLHGIKSLNILDTSSLLSPTRSQVSPSQSNDSNSGKLKQKTKVINKVRSNDLGIQRPVILILLLAHEHSDTIPTMLTFSRCIARQYNLKNGGPAADKTLMTITMAMEGVLPVPLAESIRGILGLVHTTSKVNTVLQLLLMGSSLTAVTMDVPPMEIMMAMHWLVGTTTVWSGAS
ncbi:hypothetical protein BC941DRAFT_468492 [Chlamydoabsidia padenii]|nr:hypothetical protein BC941DRAFT_468492 [Chlamydoabsidia padenii]